MELTKAEEHRGGLSQPILFWVLGAATIVGTIWSAIADGVAWYHLIPLAIGGLFAWNGSRLARIRFKVDATRENFQYTGHSGHTSSWHRSHVANLTLITRTQSMVTQKDVQVTLTNGAQVMLIGFHGKKLDHIIKLLCGQA